MIIQFQQINYPFYLFCYFLCERLQCRVLYGHHRRNGMNSCNLGGAIFFIGNNNVAGENYSYSFLIIESKFAFILNILSQFIIQAHPSATIVDIDKTV